MAMIPQYSTKLFTDVYVSADKFVADYTAKGLGGITDTTLVTKLYYLLYARYGNSPIANYDDTQWKYKVMSTIFMYGPSWESRLGIQDKLRNMSESDMMTGMKQVTTGKHSGTSNNLRSSTNSDTTLLAQETEQTLGTTATTTNNLTSTNTGTVALTGTDEIAKANKDIANHASNPSVEPATEELTFVDSQTVSNVNGTETKTLGETTTNDLTQTNTGTSAVANTGSNTGKNNATTTVNGSLQDTTSITAENTDDTSTTYSVAKLNAYQQLWELIKTDVTNEFLNKFVNLFKKFVKPERTWIYESEDGDE